MVAKQKGIKLNKQTRNKQDGGGSKRGDWQPGRAQATGRFDQAEDDKINRYLNTRTNEG